MPVFVGTSEVTTLATDRHQLEQCLNIVGFGKYTLKFYAVLTMSHASACIELFGASIVLPTARCDLNMSDEQRGFVASIPHLGILLTAYVHGYLVDVKGRKKMIIYASLITGSFSFLSALMPNLISFSICKLITSLCIAVPLVTPYTLVGELMPAEHRDLAITSMNGLMLMATSLVPLIALVIIPLDFRIPLGLIVFRPWRLLCIIYSSFLIISALILSTGPESPKFLMSQGRTEASLKVLRTMYAHNKCRPPEDFPIKRLVPPPTTEPDNLLTSIKVHTLPLLKWKYSKYLLLNGTLLLGVYCIMQGLYFWAADVLNRVLVGKDEDKTACQIIMEGTNEADNNSGKCDDSIDNKIFLINATAQLVCGIIAFAVSFILKIVGPKMLIFATFYIIGTFIMILNNTTYYVVFAVLICSFPLLVLCVGPINAYNVKIFPTRFRGMAVNLCVMLGRVGSVASNITTGAYINIACKQLFYGYGFLLYVCGALALLHK